MRWLTLLTAFAILTAPRVATQTTTADQAAPSVLATGISVPTVAVDAPKSFDEWLVDLRTEALSKGFSDGLIEETLAGLTPLERVIQSDRSQAELLHRAHDAHGDLAPIGDQDLLDRHRGA